MHRNTLLSNSGYDDLAVKLSPLFYTKGFGLEQWFLTGGERKEISRGARAFTRPTIWKVNH